MADSPSLRLYVNHVELSDVMEWNVSTEEILGGTGRATINVQTRDNSWDPEAHWDVKVVIASGPKTGHVLYRGEIITYSCDLPVGMPFRIWKLECADYNGELDQRLIGALDGKTWLDTSGLGVFVNIDPYAATLRSDKLTIQQWFEHYFRVDGTAADTSTYVGEFLTDFMTITPTYSKLKSALEQLAAFVLANLQFWLDPDLKFHWVTIPPWQDLAQDDVTTALDEAEEQLALMFGERPFDLQDIAPYAASDVTAEVGSVGFRELKFTFDGNEMPEQLYVRGGTGYVYNAPPIPPPSETKTVVLEPIAGAPGTYQITINSSTKLWHTDDTGYISLTYDTATAGGPYPCEYIYVPWNAVRNKGGHFWRILSGPYTGLLADNDTNYFGYGDVTVVLVQTVITPPGDPQIGTGGSGWVGEAVQDPNLRQDYLQAPISVTQALRDSFGAQALYRGQTPTLRGSLVASGLDGWRVGQLMKITDDRLPANLNGRYFVIQSVKTTLLLETEVRKYLIGWGDGPTSRYSYKSSRAGGAEWPPPVDHIVLDVHDLSPGPNSSQVISGQLVNGAGEPWAIAGKVVDWRLEAYNNLGVLQVGQGTLSPTISMTDGNGRAYTTFTSGSGTGLVYFIFAAVKAV